MTDLADREWRVVPEESLEGPTAMAMDEVAAETAAGGGPRTLRLYRWEPSTLSLGYNQDPGTIDWDHCERERVGVTRRPTGGGAIYHDDWGDVSYSIVVPADEVPGDLLECYHLLCEPVLDAFERLGVPVRFADEERPAVHQPACYLRALHPAHDLVGPDGRKIAGNAQYRQRDAVVQHGSLTFERRAESHCAPFAGDPDPDAFRERVTSIREHADVDREDAVAALTDALAEWADAEPGAWTDAERARGRELAAEKYATEAWTRDGESPV